MEEFFRRIYYRSTMTPSVRVPLGARSVGHYRIEPGMRDQAIVKNFFQFFWGIEGVGEFTLGDSAALLQPGELILLRPGDLHDFCSRSKVWEYRWWTMDGSLAGDLLASFGWTGHGPRHAGGCPVSLFQELENWVRKIGPAAERRGCAAAIALLAAASGEEREEDAFESPVSECLSLIRRDFGDPGLNVDILAKRLDTHRTTLARKFREQTGLSPVEYLIRVRIQHAQILLKGGRMSIAEIAGACGYEDANYFATAFRKISGVSPKEFRRQ